MNPGAQADDWFRYLWQPTAEEPVSGRGMWPLVTSAQLRAPMVTPLDCNLLPRRYDWNGLPWT